MKPTRFILSVALTGLCCCQLSAQTIETKKAKFQWGDKAEWKKAEFKDADWQLSSIANSWIEEGINREHCYAWYRIHFRLTKDMLNASDLKKKLFISLGKIDDAEETFLNGTLIGHTGSMPDSKGGYRSAWNSPRRYEIATDSPLLNWDGDNVLAVRVYNEGGGGGFTGEGLSIWCPSTADYMHVTTADTPNFQLKLTNNYTAAQKGTLTITVFNPEASKEVSKFNKKISLKNGKSILVPVSITGNERYVVTAEYKSATGSKVTSHKFVPKYILTPKAPETPRINSASRFGVRPGSPVIFRIPASGVKPMKYSVKNLPEGLQVNAEEGVISGTLKRPGQYRMTLVAENAKGKDEKEWTIECGDRLALTPPMGWNSWNCWGLSVSQEKVMASATALIERGLADYGYSYINVDDAWEAPQRNADGTIAVNEKFPSMKDLGDWLHSHGLKFGIYSSPGDYTCGRYLGSLGHEKQDAESYNSWGVDYLKYDWCGYSREFDKDRDKTVAAYVRPYLLMEKYLREQPRDIFYSLCQYGMADVWKWGHAVDANSWRTTGDINDSWESVRQIGFEQQANLAPYAQPGHWNDPDMLVVGNVGWSNSLHPSRLTPDEQYSHISLWSLLASNMLIGCDIASIDDFTIGLLCNNEVNAVNQDELGKQADRDIVDGDIQVWSRPLADGTRAVGIFNLGSEDCTVDIMPYLKKLGLTDIKQIRDLWRQKDLDTKATTYSIPTHGVKMIKVAF